MADRKVIARNDGDDGKILGSTVTTMDYWMWSGNLNGWLLPLLRAFEADESGVSGEVVSAPSSNTWI